MSENTKANLTIFLIFFFGIAGGISLGARDHHRESVEFKQEHCPHYDQYKEEEGELSGSEIYIPTEYGEALFHINSALYSPGTHMFDNECVETMSLFGYWVLKATEESVPEVEDFDLKADIVKSPIDGKIVTWKLVPFGWSNPWEITTYIFSLSPTEIRH